MSGISFPMYKVNASERCVVFKNKARNVCRRNFLSDDFVRVLPRRGQRQLWQKLAHCLVLTLTIGCLAKLCSSRGKAGPATRESRVKGRCGARFRMLNGTPVVCDNRSSAVTTSISPFHPTGQHYWPPN